MWLIAVLNVLLGLQRRRVLGIVPSLFSNAACCGSSLALLLASALWTARGLPVQVPRNLAKHRLLSKLAG